MTDDLLDQAAQLAYEYGNLVEADVLRALVERVRAAEAERDLTYWHGWTAGRAARFEDPEDNFDRAVAKLDAVRALLDRSSRNDDGDEAALRDELRAVLDGKPA